ncbi:MAG: hypothetical protein JOY71_16075 [Acetobacteraceae bacterium]|nr:hypothetical protein [Acetobacteraceae bacterium]MBV8523615.1 hypothetical protein [Acetobacteraceae bacterium]
MLTLRRFMALADSFGADLQRWPAESQKEARALLESSADARAVLAQARRLDEAIGAAHRLEEAALWLPGEPDAALARLRSGVAARIAPATPGRPRSVRGQLGWAFSGGSGLLAGPLGWATASGFAIAAGLLIGSLSGTPPASDGLLTLFQTGMQFFAG